MVDLQVTAALKSARNSVVHHLDQQSRELRDLNRQIHDHPELAYKEIFAHRILTSYLRSQGYTVKEQAYGLDTSFEAEIGKGGGLVLYCAEYDALPDIGHACGHNFIATSSMAAFTGLAAAVMESGIPGRVRILGTPAEEGGGGKVRLISAGAFDGDISAAIMAHPITTHRLKGEYTGVAGVKLIASHKLRVEFHGKRAHAGATPWNGINALDAAVAAYNNVSMLRQQIQHDERIHGVIEDGGTVPNVIPAYTRMNFYVRSPTIERANSLLARVKNCFEAAATSSGCTVNYIEAPTYMDLRINNTLSQSYVEEMAALGEAILFRDELPLPASTDMGNVSYKVPSFHGGFAIPTPPSVNIHHPSFTTAAGTDEAHAIAIQCAKGLAMLGWHVLTDSQLSDRARREFEMHV